MRSPIAILPNFKLLSDGNIPIDNDQSERTIRPLTVGRGNWMLLGRAGTQLLPLMQDGAAGIEALQKQARELGLTISTDDADAAATLTDTLNILWRVFKQGVFVVGSALAPVMKDFAERAARIIKNTFDWVKQNKELIVTVFKVAAAVMAGGAALIVLGGLLSGLGTIFGMLASLAAGDRFHDTIFARTSAGIQAGGR